MDVKTLLHLMKDEEELVSQERFVIENKADDPAIQVLVVQELSQQLPAIKDSASRPPADYQGGGQQPERSPSAIPELSASTRQDDTLGELGECL